MDEGTIFDILRQGLWTALLMSLPILAVSLVVGLGVGLLQALTTIQEMTLTFAPKLAAILVVFWMTMGFMAQTIIAYFTDHIMPLIEAT